jgi:hypothetical protein
MGTVAVKEEYTVPTIDIISQLQYFVAHCHNSYGGHVCLFTFCPQASNTGKVHRFVPVTVTAQILHLIEAHIIFVHVFLITYNIKELK